MKTIYLDHNATTPIHPEVIDAMVRCWRDQHANPASQHRPGQRAHRLLEEAREEIASLLGADLTSPQPDRLIFTSGGTEANNLAILGMARAAERLRSTQTEARPSPDAHFRPASTGEPNSSPGFASGPEATHRPTRPLGEDQPAHAHQIIISAMEHPSVLEPAEQLLEAGWRFDTLAADRSGVVRVELLGELLSPKTRLVSVMLVNHETGVIQPVGQIAGICQRAGVPVHTDAVQAAGKLPLRFRDLGVGAMSIGAHKFGGPLGIGALLLRHGVPIEPLLFGGPHQGGLRPGTESLALVIGMLTALRICYRELATETDRMTRLRDRFEAGLRAGLPDVVINGAEAPRLPYTSNVAFPGLDAQILLVALDSVGVACSVGSACSSGSTETSPTLRAMGLPKELLLGSLRFSFGHCSSIEEIDEAVRRILLVVKQLRSA